MDFPLITPASANNNSGINNRKTNSAQNIPLQNSHDEFVKPEKMSVKKKGGIIAAISAATLSFGAVIKNIRKPSDAKIAKRLIKELQPENIELAKTVFPILFKNGESLKIKQEHYNSLLNGIEKNRDFMLSEGLNLITSKAEKINEYINNPEHDILSLIEALNPANKKIFSSVTDRLSELKVEFMDDIAMYLKKLNPQRHDYIFDELLPELTKHDEALSISTPEKLAAILNHIEPEFQTTIEKLSLTKATAHDCEINAHKVLTAVNKENYKCVEPLLDNFEKYELDTDSLVKVLGFLKNENAHSVKPVFDTYESITELKFDPKEIFEILENTNCDKIYSTVMGSAKTFKITDIDDLKCYIKNLSSKDTEFLTKIAIPKLENHIKTFDFSYSEQIAEVLAHTTPETAASFDIVAKYASNLGPHCAYNVLLCSVDKNNIKNLPKLMEDIKNTELWDNYLVDTSDFRKYLDK